MAGTTVTPAAPWSRRSTTACHIRSVPVRKSSPHDSDATMNRIWPAWISFRQSYRSASAPEYTEKSRNGIQWLMTAKPASMGE